MPCGSASEQEAAAPIGTAGATALASLLGPSTALSAGCSVDLERELRRETLLALSSSLSDMPPANALMAVDLAVVGEPLCSSAGLRPPNSPPMPPPMPTPAPAEWPLLPPACCRIACALSAAGGAQMEGSSGRRCCCCASPASPYSRLCHLSATAAALLPSV